MVTRSPARVAACAAVVILAVVAAFQLYWALGGTWAGGADLAGYSETDRAILGLVSLLYAGVLLVRVGYWHDHLPSAVARFADLNTWLIVILPLGGAIRAFTTVDDPVGGILDLTVAALAFVVARSERPMAPTSGTASAPSGNPGPSASRGVT